MYKLEYLPGARQDLIEMMQYISRELKNPQAANRRMGKFSDATEGLTTFPYACPLYVPIRPLKYEYRKLMVQNYLVLYWIDEKKQTVTIARVVYAKRDYGRMLADANQEPDL